VLTLGVSLTELDTSAHKPHRATGTTQRPMIGFVCVLLACLTSGFAGVWFEKILKDVRGTRSKVAASSDGASGRPDEGAGTASTSISQISALSTERGRGQAAETADIAASQPKSMWTRNIQMGLTSVPIALLAAYTKDRAVIAEKGFFYGYNSSVIGVICLQAFGGLVVAAVVKYADNILKGFGSSISIIVSCSLEWAFFDFHPTARFVVGAGLVNAALFLYQGDCLFTTSNGEDNWGSCQLGKNVHSEDGSVHPEHAQAGALPEAKTGFWEEDSAGPEDEQSRMLTERS
jgi:hypothetical protein